MMCCVTSSSRAVDCNTGTHVPVRTRGLEYRNTYSSVLENRHTCILEYTIVNRYHGIHTYIYTYMTYRSMQPVVGIAIYYSDGSQGSSGSKMNANKARPGILGILVFSIDCNTYSSGTRVLE